MHFGTGPTEEGAEDACEDCDPFLLEDHLIELRECHKFSKSVFFIVSSVFKHPYTRIPLMLWVRTGNKYHHPQLPFIHPPVQTLLGTEIGNLMPPTSIDSATCEALRKRCTTDAEINLLQNCYGKRTISSSPSTTLLRTEKGQESAEKYVLNRDYR